MTNIEDLDVTTDSSRADQVSEDSDEDLDSFTNPQRDMAVNSPSPLYKTARRVSDELDMEPDVFPRSDFTKLMHGLFNQPGWTVYPACLTSCLRAAASITKHGNKYVCRRSLSCIMVSDAETKLSLL